MKLQSVLCFTASLIAISATPAAAQALPDPAAQSDATRAVQPDANPSDIIVTARRIDERLQDVPISIAVFSQQQLDNRNITSGRDLAIYTPSLQTNERFGTSNVTFAIRGFTQEIRTTPSVGVYFAEVVAPRGGGGTPSGDGAGPGSFFDLQNVQVLRGPQGTLFGRNTTGGAILLTPQKPTQRFEGYLEGSLGDYDMRRIQGAINVPLTDDAAFRVAFDKMKRDGYLRNISGIGSDDFNDSNYYAIRASLLVSLTPDLENYLVGSFSRTNENGPVQQVRTCVAGAGLAALIGGLCTAQLARQRAGGHGDFAVDNILPDNKSVAQQWQLIDTMKWQATDNLTVRNIVSYAEYRNELRASLFGTDFIVPAPLPFAGARITFANAQPLPAGNADQSTFSEELQFQGQTERLQWQAGGYLEISKPLRARFVSGWRG